MQTPLLKEELTAVIATACNRAFTNRGKQAPNYFKQFLKKVDTDSAQWITLDMAYFGEIPIKKPGVGMEYDTIKFGTPKITDPLSFALAFGLTREALLAMRKKPYGEITTAKMISTQKIAASMSDSVNHTKELGAALVVTLADQVVQTPKYNSAGRRGLALASQSQRILKQPGTVWSNWFAGETLSQASLGKMIQAAMTIPSDEGMIRGFSKNWKLLHGPKLLNRAYEVTETKLNNDSANHNVSVLNQFKITPVCVPYFGADFTGYALQSDDHEMYYFAPEDEVFEDEEDFNTKGHRFSTYFQQAWTFESPYGFLFNPGVA
jgi:hypothetical protein